ncbi:MAG TPA: protein kinase [Verrucomicrobiae bacterium]
MPAGLLGLVCPRCAAGFLHATPTEPAVSGESRRVITPPAPAELAALFPQLEILAFIGQGGMGAVYKARQRELDRVVALKLLPGGIGEDPAFAERFAREAKAMARLNHPGIVTIYDFGRADGQFYFLMEFVDGVSLGQLIHNGRVSSREALAIVPQICDALQYAHDQGLVHRDIKPENILLDRQGRVKVADFGLVKLMESSREPTAPAGTMMPDSPLLTQAGKVMGTPHYMAPEQVTHPAEVDHRADIYALGVVLYQMLTGELPGKHIEPPSQKVQVDVRLDEVVLRALAAEPERRYQQASQVKTAVETISRSQNSGAQENRLPGDRKPSEVSESRVDRAFIGHVGRRTVAFLTIGALLVIGLLLLAVWKGHQTALDEDLKDLLAGKKQDLLPGSHPTVEGDKKPTAVFGPVIERTLSIRGNECDFLSLRTGDVLRHSYVDGDANDSTPPSAFMQWVMKSGVDIGFCASTDKFHSPFGLLTLGMGTYIFPYDPVPQDLIPRFRSVAEWQTYNAQHELPAKNPLVGSLAGVTNIWDDLTADQMEGPTNEAPAFFLKEKHFSLWFRSTNLTTHPIAFSTRDGVEGLLEITGFTENPRGVKLRYKLVSHAALPEAGAQTPTNHPKQVPEWVRLKPLDGWIADLQSSDPSVRTLAERAIAECGTNALPEFLTILDDRDPSSQGDDRRYNAAAALRFIGPEIKSAIASFVSLLVSGNQESAYAGARALAFTTPIVPEAFVQLTNGLVHFSPEVRDAATHGVDLLLGSESNGLAESALPTLLGNLKDDAQYVRADTASALRTYVQTQRIHGRDAKPDLIIPAVIPLLEDKYSFARQYAGMVITGYAEQAVPVLLKLLDDSDGQVRARATNALGAIRYGPSPATSVVSPGARERR